MKKHVFGLFLSGALLALTACGTPDSSSSSSSSQQSTGGTSSSQSSESSASSSSSSSESSAPVESEPANGLFTFVKKSYEERTEILGKLEKWAVEHKLTGLTLYGDGGYVMYNPSVSKGTNNYIPGYGFGIVTEGELTADLEGEANPDYKRYYHMYETDDPGKINYMDDKGSVVGDLIGYTNDAYFTNFMNDTKDGYIWAPSLSSVNRPVAVGADEDGYATTYRIYVKTSEVKYATNSEIAKYAKYNGQAVKLEDYVTPYKIYYTAAYGMARGSENLTGSGSIAGSKAYYDASAGGFDAAAWEKIGIKTGTDNAHGDFIQFTFNQPCNRFYAMYYLSSSMFAPVPAEFIEDLGNGDFAAGTRNWGVATDTESIIDHWLCTGPYAIERWDTNQQIVFKKNPFYTRRDPNHYKIAGVHFNILTAQKTDEEAAFKEFLANKLHGSGIPSKQLANYKNDPRTTVTKDSSTYKLNLNTCDQATWNSLFGVNGTITKTEESKYWKCKPAMQNSNFVDGLSFAIDRATFAETVGRTPSGNFFGNGYMSNPEEGIRYNDTQAHKDAVAAIQEGTVDGFSLEKAKNSFKLAAQELIASGAYKQGDKIEIEVAWQTTSQEQREHALLEQMIEGAFNVEGMPLTLDLVSYVPAVWSDVYYKKMMVGQFDIGFGSVTGNTLDPLNFLEVLKSNNSSGFTLNWGVDTDDAFGDLIDYDGKLWTFDALYTAADQGAAVADGAIDSEFSCELAIDPTSVKGEFDEAGALTVTFNCHEDIVTLEDGSIGAFSAFGAICIFGCSDGTYADYEEYYLDRNSCVITESNDAEYETKVTATFPADVTAYYMEFPYLVGLDVYSADYFLGVEALNFVDTIAYLVTPAA